ncbi:MAG: hypothetical protein C6W55_09775 [Thermobacillus sp.]|uniref:YcnI family copper-binding membrane protein n=1 Tax=Thermobacillus sp. TaxID=2108467 RepID=UPI000E37CDBB|nr:YcnI family protein [Thermobacillus sp.]REK55275.1 MAG: hypothetical protein C6W55_09775 [Thermobacillus sp.]
MKRIMALTAGIAVFLLAALPASAHVTIWPNEVEQGAYVVFTVRVPSEKEGTETTAVHVVFPEAVNITRFEPKPGWTVEFERNADQVITEVSWTAEPGHGLDVTEFAEFRMSGRVLPDADTESLLVWKAYQTYADGSVVEWIGAPDTDSPTPAPAIAVVPGNPADDGHGHGGETQASASSSSAKEDVSYDALIVALIIVAWLLSITALTLSLVLLLQNRRKQHSAR